MEEDETRLISAIGAIAEVIVELGFAEFLGSVFTFYGIRRLVVFLIWVIKHAHIQSLYLYIYITEKKKEKEIG